MVTKKQIIEEYGQELGNKILKNRYLVGITVKVLPNGDFDIPRVDVDRALRHIRNQKINDFD